MLLSLNDFFLFFILTSLRYPIPLYFLKSFFCIGFFDGILLPFRTFIFQVPFSAPLFLISLEMFLFPRVLSLSSSSMTSSKPGTTIS